MLSHSGVERTYKQNNLWLICRIYSVLFFKTTVLQLSSTLASTITCKRIFYKHIN